MFVRVRAERCYGVRRITQELKQKGIDSELGKQVLAEADIDCFELAIDCFNRKYRRLYDPQLIKAHDKCLRSMAARGFSFEQIYHAITAPAADYY